jgi:bidirectional [NiFe] hydrogenase diaphorase subunit
MIDLYIDGQAVRTEEGKTILAVARDAGIHIPTLCYHDALSPAGACRLCIVEVHPEGETQSRLTSSCNSLVKNGMKVLTHSERVLEAQRRGVERLLEKAGKSKVIQEIATDVGVERAPDTFGEDSNCILCRLCVRACREAIGADALKLIPKRDKKEPHIQFLPESCIGCAACFLLCPTGFIKMEEIDGQRIIWGTAFRMKKCSRCGSFTTTEAHWNYLEERAGASAEFNMAKDMCPACRRDSISSELLDLRAPCLKLCKSVL